MKSIPPDDLAAALANATDRLGLFAGRVRLLGETSSTNDDAAALAEAGAEEGVTVIADAQSAGRGRRGHSWFSPPGDGLYISSIFRPVTAWSGDGDRLAAPLLTLAAGVATASGIRASTGVAAEIKWPNDIIVHATDGPYAGARLKVAGILAEASSTGRSLRYVVLGIGINVRRTALPAGLSAIATSLEHAAGQPIDRAQVLVECLSALAHEYDALRDRRAADVLQRWRALSPSHQGAPVSWRGADREVRRGKTAGVAADGALLVWTDDDVIERIIGGEVVWG